MLQAVKNAHSSARLRIDCKAAVDILLSGRDKAVCPSRITARAWADIFTATGGEPPSDVSWTPAHTAVADIGRRRLGNGQFLSRLDRLGNDEADRLAKAAVQAHRVPRQIRDLINTQESEVRGMAWWVAHVTIAANSWGPQEVRDSESAPRGRRKKVVSGTRNRPARQEIPAMLGGHDIVRQPLHLSRLWHCRVCRRSAKVREALCYSRCPGSAVQRWARAAAVAAQSGEPIGGKHDLSLNGPVVRCFTCGALACTTACLLSQPCPGRTRGFWKQAWQRLLLGLHPSSRLPLGADAMPEPGSQLPAGFAAAIRGAEASRTSAAGMSAEVPPSAQHALVTTPRLTALRDRVLAKQAAARATSLHVLPPKRQRLRGKQPAPGEAGQKL